MKAHPAVMIAIGLFTAIGAMADWDWFMNNHRARIFVSMFGRDGARIFYGVVGAAFIIFGVVLMQRQP